MIFGEFPCEAAEGVMLAHTLKVGSKRLKKGRVLTAQDLGWLRQAGIETVLGARLAVGDVAEDPAAAEIAALLIGPNAIGPNIIGPNTNTEVRPPYTGRCNLHASTRGLVQIDTERLDRLNLLDESVAIATLPQHAPARPGQVIASVKIIPFAVPRSLIDACRNVASDGPLLRVAPLRPARAALIMSELPGMKESIFEGTVAATRHRLEAVGSRLALVLRCAHDRGALAAMLDQARAAGCDLLLVCGATVAKDRNDIAPAAVTSAGGVIEHFGMPVEPGNMLVLARLASVPVVILPGCGRSRRTNGLDWVLRRLLAGLTPTREDIMRMGVGGLIRHPAAAEAEPETEPETELEAEREVEPEAEGEPESEQKREPEGEQKGGREHHRDLDVDRDDDGPQDRDHEVDTALPRPATHGPRVGALVLAAGRSSRMGAENKLLMAVGGVPMVLRAVNAARGSRATSVTVVVGHQAEVVETVLAGSQATVVRNPDHARGMSSSLRHGIAALPDDVDAVLVLLGDMPRITADHLDRIIAAFDPAHPMIVVPERDGRRGNPILWPREFFPAMRRIDGDQGARGLLEHNPERVRRITIDDDAIFLDVDRPADLAKAEAQALVDTDDDALRATGR